MRSYPDGGNHEGAQSPLSRSTKMILAVALHCIPEEMAIQNIPEGAIISVPLRSEGKSRSRAFTMGALSGLVEPIAAVATMLFLDNSSGAMPALLAFAAGAMLYVVVEELIPSSQHGKHSNTGTITFAACFMMIMLLDVILN